MPRRSNSVFLTGAQLRAARALVNLRAEELADEAKITLRTIGRIEKLDGAASLTTATAERIIEVLKKHRVVLLPENGEGAGVRLKKNR